MVIYSGFSHEKWWFSIAMLVYQRVSPKFPFSHLRALWSSAKSGWQTSLCAAALSVPSTSVGCCGLVAMGRHSKAWMPDAEIHRYPKLLQKDVENPWKSHGKPMENPWKTGKWSAYGGFFHIHFSLPYPIGSNYIYIYISIQFFSYPIGNNYISNIFESYIYIYICMYIF